MNGLVDEVQLSGIHNHQISHPWIFCLDILNNEFYSDKICNIVLASPKGLTASQCWWLYVMNKYCLRFVLILLHYYYIVILLMSILKFQDLLFTVSLSFIISSIDFSVTVRFKRGLSSPNSCRCIFFSFTIQTFLISFQYLASEGIN